MELVSHTSIVLPRDLVARPKGEQDRVEALVALAGEILEMSPQGSVRRACVPFFLVLVFDGTVRFQDAAQSVKPTERREDRLSLIDRLP